MFSETITYTLRGKKHSSAAGRQQGAEGLFPQPEAGAVMQNPSTEPGTLAAVTAVERDCHFQTTIHLAQKQVSQTGLVNQTSRIPGFPPQEQKGCRHPPQTATSVLQIFTSRWDET